jgi:hypothetical protein
MPWTLKNWVPHAGKHRAKAGVPWGRIVANTANDRYPAKYKHEINQKALETLVIEKGYSVHGQDNLHALYYVFDDIIGASP